MSESAMPAFSRAFLGGGGGGRVAPPSLGFRLNIEKSFPYIATANNNYLRFLRIRRGGCGLVSLNYRSRDRVTAIRNAIYGLVRRIPRGCVLSYGDVSRIVGTGPRQVAAAMRECPAGLPWHRV